MKQVTRQTLRVLLISIIILSTGCIVAGIMFTSSGIYFSFSFPKVGWMVWEPNWSPAGDLIAFRCIFISPEKLGFDSYDFYTWSDICVTDQNGKHFRILTSESNVSNFSWSPDGKMLAWAHESDLVWESISIWDNQKQTSEIFFLSEEIQWLSNLKWSKDAQEIYLGDSGAIFDITKEKLFLPPKQEVDGNEFFSFIRSPDGEYLALSRYMNFPSGQADLVITKNEKPVYVGYEADNSSIYSWSPTDNILAWIGRPIPKNLQDPGKSYDDVLFLTYAPTGETIKYEASSGLLFDFADVFWSSDGTKLAISDTGSAILEVFEFTQADHGFPLSIAHRYQVTVRW